MKTSTLLLTLTLLIGCGANREYDGEYQYADAKLIVKNGEFEFFDIESEVVGTTTGSLGNVYQQRAHHKVYGKGTFEIKRVDQQFIDQFDEYDKDYYKDNLKIGNPILIFTYEGMQPTYGLNWLIIGKENLGDNLNYWDKKK
ncbi:MAG: hypothetical protein HND39_13865 [Ignavibacteriota bacterium]|jgi:hypothetical protein|uniref:hypothetical protein n=1 Tax=Ignavibacterium album TaxID=591197 RepID=UPI001598751E|nr:hypothetical protein [Ignavibacteriales bacterium]MCL4280093.1 hypothetical protein [Ignavibacteriaceae bacterium]QKJ97284.1 MAG: hypothetical protein HND39_13865 [Ignavibacteriota bacterium]GJQ42702.1 MAG: hypothetical protein JETCAE03_22000 [Ignavibacteriaceae bacterium]